VVLSEVVRQAVGPFEEHCDGYSNPGASGFGYITAVTMDLGVARETLDQELATIIAYDRASSNGTYIGQINMLQASSFTGVNGEIWGYDIAHAEGPDSPLFEVRRPEGPPLPAYSLDPLLDASRRLLGTREERRFRLLPGCLVAAAMKGTSASGECWLWCAMGLAIAHDRDIDASLFMEDYGVLPAGDDPAAFGQTELRRMAQSVPYIEQDQLVRYRRVSVGYKYERVPANHVGAAMLVAPYLVLARRAVPPAGPEALLTMTISQWERAVGI